MKNIETIISGNIVDIVKREIYKGKVFIKNDKIEKIIKCEVVENVYLLPGLVDSHVHIESSMLTPTEFAKIAVKHGTVATISDPHEIANVLGIQGINFMIDDIKDVPFKMFFGAPSCVPATDFETSGYKLNDTDIDKLLSRNDIYYLSEMMNFPGVIYNDKSVISKIESAKKYNKKIDGHAPMLSGKDLEKYIYAGISTDHECSTIIEAEEKLKLGMKIQIREGSAAKNFENLHKLIDKFPNEIMLCSDDIHPDNLVEGHINKLIKKGIDKKIDIFNLLQSATLNPIKHYNLNIGLLQEGNSADLIMIDNLDSFYVLKTIINGNIVYENGHSKIESKNKISINNFNSKTISEEDIIVAAKSKKIRVIEAIDGDLFSNEKICEAKIENECVVPDINNDILKVVVLNRYKIEKPIVGFIYGFGLNHGAIASSIAHDSHNIIAVGADDTSIVRAINTIVNSKGGIVVIDKNEEFVLQLEIAGLMSAKNGNEVAEKYKNIDKKAKNLRSKLSAPFMTLSFMSLLVIPKLKIGDKGLFDGTKFQFTNIFVDDD